MTTTAIAWAVGILSAFAIVKRIMFRRYARRMGFAGGGWGQGFGRHGGGGRWGKRGIGRSFWLRAIFAKLDTTPGQEREIRAAIEEMQDRAVDAKKGMPETRTNIARAVGTDDFDMGALEAFNARVDATAEMMKDAFGSTLRRIHGVLDAKQRQRLAELIASGGFRGFGGPGGGPYRTTEVL